MALYRAQGNEIAVLDSRVTTVEEQLERYSTINSGQVRVIRRIAGARIRELLKSDEEYKQLRSQYYSWLYHKVQDTFNVTSITDLRLKHYEVACDFIREWTPITSAKSA